MYTRITDKFSADLINGLLAVFSKLWWGGVKKMIIREACSAAFYCQRCGKIHMHDIPYFADDRIVLHCDSCGHGQMVCQRLDGNQISFSSSCVVCGEENRIVYPLRKLRHIQMEKVFCQRDHFELGYIGRRSRIEEFLSFNQAEFEALHPHDGKNFIEKQRILLEALNRVHELAACGSIVCPCGRGLISADIKGSSIHLECGACGSYYVLRAETEGDLAQIAKGMDISLIALDLARKH